MTHKELVSIMAEVLTTMNQSVSNQLGHPQTWIRSSDDSNEPLRKFTWTNSENAILEMSIYDDGTVEFEVVAGNDENLAVILDCPSEIYSWDRLPLNILNSFVKE